MKNYFIVLLIVVNLFFLSYLYKIGKQNIFNEFPAELELNQKEPTLYLFLFFSVNNCRPCLEIIDVLNDLPSQFHVTGVIPEKEYRSSHSLNLIKTDIGVEFEIIMANKFKNYIPHYSPTLFAVTKEKKILFVLPAVPEEKEFLKLFLNSFYKRGYPIIFQDFMIK